MKLSARNSLKETVKDIIIELSRGAQLISTVIREAGGSRAEKFKSSSRPPTSCPAWTIEEREPDPQSLTRAARISRQKAGRSEGTREVTRLPSRTTSSST